MEKIIKYIPPFCFFLTGFASLLDEVLWTKILSMIFGSSLVATGFVLFLFMVFLGIGSFLGGKISALSRKPLKVYGIIEIIIGTFTILTPFLFDFIKSLSYANSFYLTYILTFFILSPIIFLMGTTFPIFLKSQRKREENYSKEIGIVYGLNLIGASLGALIGGFFLMPNLGIKVSLISAGILDIFAGILVFFISNSFEKKEREENSLLRFSKGEKKAILIVFLGGFSALSLEVVWFKVLSLFIGSSTYSFTLMVSAFILGLFIGSIFLSKKGDNFKDNFSLLSEVHILICFFSTIVSIILIIFPFFYIKIAKFTSAKFIALNIFLFILLFLFFIIPTSFMGSAVPIAIKAGTEKKEEKSKVSGIIYCFSSFGSALGAIFTSLIFIPNFGSKMTFFFAFLSSLFASFLSSRESFKLKGKNFKIFIFLIFLWILWTFKVFPWDWRILTAGWYAYTPYYVSSYQKMEVKKRDLFLERDPQIGIFIEDFKGKEFTGTELLFLKEGLFSQVAVVEDKGVKSLLINGKADASNGREDMRTQVLLAHLPALFLREVKGNGCVIGLGSGVTAGALTLWDFEKIYVYEIEKEVLSASYYFKDENLNFYEDKRVEIKIKDARKGIFSTDLKFSLITSEPSNLWMSGTSSLFTKEFFNEIYNKLEEDGIFCQWLHLYQISLEDVKIFLNTINSVFPFIYLYADGEDLLLVSSKKKMEIEPKRWLDKISKNENLKYQLGSWGFYNLSDLLKNFICDERGIKVLVKDGKLHRDDYPILEYSAAKWIGFNFSKEILSKLIEAGKKAGPIEFEDFGFIE